MKRNVLVVGVVILGWFVTGQPVQAQSTTVMCGGSPPCRIQPPADPTIIKVEAKNPHVAALLKVLAQTRSSDCFLVTLQLLSQEEWDTRACVPFLLRHAERVGILSDHMRQAPEGGTSQRMIKDLFELLTKMNKPTPGSITVPSARYLEHPPQYFTPTRVGTTMGAALGAVSGGCTEPVPTQAEVNPRGKAELQVSCPFPVGMSLVFRCVQVVQSMVHPMHPVLPIPPWVTERLEEKYDDQADCRTPPVPAIPDSSSTASVEPPDDASVLRALPSPKHISQIYEESRSDIQIVKELIVDRVDPPRFYPLVGQAQRHRCQWKCTVSYNETIQSSYPFPFRCVRPRVRVVYIDRDHLHACPVKKQ